LSSSDTRVRCGECLSIFDALEELRAANNLSGDAAKLNTGSSQIAVGATQTSAVLSAQASAASKEVLDVTYSDFDLFSEEADLPEIAYFDQTRDTPDFDFDSVELGSDETFSDTLFVHDVTIDADATTLRAKPVQKESSDSAYADIDFVEDAQPREPLIFNYRDAEHPLGKVGSSAKSVQNVEPITPAAAPSTTQPSQSEVTADVLTDNTASLSAATAQLPELEEPTRRNPWMLRIGMLLLLGVLLGALFAHRTRPSLYNNPTLRPMLEAGCKLLTCTLPARVDLDALSMVKRNVYSHPNTPNALVINVSFRNDADFAQQLPLLHMVLTNRVGRTVAQKDFIPQVYLPGWQKGDVIEAEQQLDVTLEVTDPGRDAQSFEFYFREHKS